VAIGSNLSAFWILVANSFMQQPVGYQIAANGRAEMTDFFALLGNPHVWVQFPHVFFSGITTAAFFVLGISAYHLYRKNDVEFFRRSFQIAVVYGVIGSLMVILVGHSQAQHMVETQPMKMAAAEALWETEDPASMSIFTLVDEAERRDVFNVRIPRLLSLLAYNRLDGEVKGINDLEVEYQQKYGPGDYAPPIAMAYWTFRAMVGAGFAMAGLALLGLYLVLRNRIEQLPWLLRWLPLAIALPYIANSTGWLLTELGRQPWVVFGLMKTTDGVSATVTGGMVLFSVIAFTLLYGALMVADMYLMVKYAKAGPNVEH